MTKYSRGEVYLILGHIKMFPSPLRLHLLECEDSWLTRIPGAGTAIKTLIRVPTKININQLKNNSLSGVNSCTGLGCYFKTIIMISEYTINYYEWAFQLFIEIKGGPLNYRFPEIQYVLLKLLET